MMSDARGWVGLFLLVFATGCSSAPHDTLDKPLFPVSGKISYQGRPIPNALVTFHPVERLTGGPTAELVRAPFAIVKEDGSFELTTLRSADGAPEGDYEVTVSWSGGAQQSSDNDTAPEKLPPKYQNPLASGIRVQVRSGQSIPDIRLN